MCPVRRRKESGANVEGEGGGKGDALFSLKRGFACARETVFRQQFGVNWFVYGLHRGNNKRYIANLYP